MTVRSGVKLGKEIRKLRGEWPEILTAAGNKFGERGRVMAILRQPRVKKESIAACVNILEDAGFSVDRVLQVTQQARTLSGLRAAINLAYRSLEENVCPNFFKEGKNNCRKGGCRLRHKIPKHMLVLVA